MIAQALQSLLFAATGLAVVVGAVAAVTVPQFTSPRRTRFRLAGVL